MFCLRWLEQYRNEIGFFSSLANPGPNFYVPIAEKDLQLLTEPSLINYVTDAATEDQLVREQYSPS